MFQQVYCFLKNEDGAVTVDWVVLCAGIVAMAAAIITSMQTSTVGLAETIELYMSSYFS